MRVEVYRNLHTGTWSVRDLDPGSSHRGRVIAHPKVVLIDNPRFVVQPAGRDKVRSEGRKNVHAFVRGDLLEDAPEFDCADYAWVTYNPYKNDTFVRRGAEDVPVIEARFALLGPNSVWAYWEVA